MTTERTTAPPQIPDGRMDGQRFFRVQDRRFLNVQTEDFHYDVDEPVEGFTYNRHKAWANAVAYAEAVGAELIEERTSQRLNDYVGSPVYGLCFLNGEITNYRLSGTWDVGASALLTVHTIS